MAEKSKDVAVSRNIDVLVGQFLENYRKDLGEAGFSFNSESSESSETSESSESSESSETSEISEGVDFLNKYLEVIDPDPQAWGAILRVAGPVLEVLRADAR